MKFTEKLVDMGQRTPVISQIIKIQNSAIYPILMAMLCIVSGTSGKNVYVPCMWVLTVGVIFAGLFSSDLKVFFVPFIMGLCYLGLDVTSDFYTRIEDIPTFDRSAIPNFVVCIALMLTVLIFRLATSGMLKEAFFKRGMLFWGIIFLDVAFIINGAFCQGYSFTNLLLGIGMAAVLTGCYFIFLPILSSSEKGITYLCVTLVATSYAVMAQTAIAALKLWENENLFITYGAEYFVNRSILAMGWGPVTVTATVITLGIPAALYLARMEKLSFFSFFSAPIFLATAVFINTRSAVVVGAIMLVVGMICCITGGKNRLKNIIYTVIFVVAVSVLVAKFYDRIVPHVVDILKTMRVYSSDGIKGLFVSRTDIWKNGIEDFLSAPVFGVGFLDGGFEAELMEPNIYRNMYHNVFVQFLASMGVLGLLAYLIHLKHMLELTVRGFSAQKLLLLCVPFMIIGASFVDNFFFYPNFQIIYAAFIAAAEVTLERRRRERLERLKPLREGEKPKVVFTFVEAGMGHIVPTRTVCDAFKEKYGDRAEVVESRFFTETGDKNMEKTEILFRRAVKSQNRSPILSALCKIGNTIAGDAFALQVLLSMTVSGVKTCPRAVSHAEELDAHLIYTAHWAVPYYVNRMKAPRPYTVCFCPDVLSNGVFNVDCNQFLISGEKGYRGVERVRMYAGGNVKRIPFPMRREVASLRGADKRALRRSLGLDTDKFTVTLSDGGYGMARMEKTVEYLVKADVPMTVIALCGTNDELYSRLNGLSHNENIDLVVLPFTDRVAEYIAASDLYAGKSGANSVAEPAALGVPIMITKCITYIERNIKNYYVRDVKGAMYIPSARRAAIRIEKLAQSPDGLKIYADNLKRISSEEFDPYATADLLWELLCRRERQ